MLADGLVSTDVISVDREAMGSLFRPAGFPSVAPPAIGGATGVTGYWAVTWLDWAEATLVPTALMATTVNR